MSFLSLNYLQTSLDKGTIKRLLTAVWRVYGLNVSIDTFDELKEIGFEYSTSVGFSMSLGDLIIPPQKKWMMSAVKLQDEFCEHQIDLGLVTPIEQFQRLMDFWYLTSEALRGSIVSHFAQTNTRNPVYTIAQSGARGSMAQVRQLVGMRGLMANPQGEVVEYPIRANFREGLTLAEFAISGYGGRKGLVDTAVRTADAGYLTRRLVDVSHVVVIRQLDCGTHWSIPLRKLIGSDGDQLLPITKRAIGRVLTSNPIIPSLFDELKCYPNQTIDRNLLSIFSKIEIITLPIRSPLTCSMWTRSQEIKAPKNQAQGICQLCYGWDYSEERIVDLNQAVGIVAAQSIGEPGTQLTMRTFHTGGVFEGKAIKKLRSTDDGIISFDIPVQGSIFRTSYGNQAFLTYSPTYLRIKKETDPDEVFLIPSRSILYHRPGEKIHANQPVFELNQQLGPQSRGRVMITEHLLLSEATGQVWCPKSKPFRKVAYQKNWTLKFRSLYDLNQKTLNVDPQYQKLGISYTNNDIKINDKNPSKGKYRIQISSPQIHSLSLQQTIDKVLSKKKKTPLTLKPTFGLFHKILDQYKLFVKKKPIVSFLYQHQLKSDQPRFRAYKSFIDQPRRLNYSENIYTNVNHHLKDRFIPSEYGQVTGSLTPLEPVWVLEGFLIKLVSTFHPYFEQGSPNGLPWGFFLNKDQSYVLDAIQFINSSNLSFSRIPQKVYPNSTNTLQKFYEHKDISRPNNLIFPIQLINSKTIEPFLNSPKKFKDYSTIEDTEFFYCENQRISNKRKQNLISQKLLLLINVHNLQRKAFLLRPTKLSLINSGQNPGKANNRILQHWFSNSALIPTARKTQSQWAPSEFWFGKNLSLTLSKLNLKCRVFNWVWQNKNVRIKKQLIRKPRLATVSVKRNPINNVFLKLARNNFNSFIFICLRTNFIKAKLLQHLFEPSEIKEMAQKSWKQWQTTHLTPNNSLPSDFFFNFLLIRYKSKVKTYQSRILVSKTLTTDQKIDLVHKTQYSFSQTYRLLLILKYIFHSHKSLDGNSIQKILGYSYLPSWRKSVIHPFRKQTRVELNQKLENQFSSFELQKTIQLGMELMEGQEELKRTSLLTGIQNSSQFSFPLSPLGGSFMSLKKVVQRGKVGLCTFHQGQGWTAYCRSSKIIGSWTLTTNYPRLAFLPYKHQSSFVPTGIQLPAPYVPKFGKKLHSKGVDLYGQRWIKLSEMGTKSTHITEFSAIPQVQSLFNANGCHLCWVPSDAIFSFNHSNLTKKPTQVGTIYEKQTKLCQQKSVPFSGQVTQLSRNKLSFRTITGYPISRTRALFYLHHGSIVNEGDPIYNYSYQKQRTGDIVQGIPVIESLFEGRVKRKGAYVIDNLRVPARDESIWQGTARGGGGGRSRIFESTLSSLLGVRIALVNRIQGTYLQQGVEFSDKHVEVIVRRFTSQVLLKTGGGTRHLPSEKVHEFSAQSNAWFSGSTYSHRLKLCLAPTPKFLPSVTGLTKTALFAQSFLGSASFQESSKTFIRIGVKGSQNFLSGLKDQVITGRTLRFSSPIQGFSAKTLFIVSYKLKDKLPKTKPQLPFLLLPVVSIKNCSAILQSQNKKRIYPSNFFFSTHPLHWVLFVTNSGKVKVKTRVQAIAPICLPLWFHFPQFLGGVTGIGAAVTVNQVNITFEVAQNQNFVYNNIQLTQDKKYFQSGYIYFYNGIGLISFGQT